MKTVWIVLFCASSVGWAQFDLGGVDPFKVGEGVAKMTKGASGVGAAEEAAIGGAVAVELVAANGGIWKDEAASRRVALIGKTLARHSDRPLLNFRFGILNNGEVNGYSAPGGYVFITRGAYEAVRDDEELAGILAHEISHVTRRHALKIIARTEFMSGLSDVASGASTDFRAYDLGVDRVSRTLLKTGYDPATEYDADRAGCLLAYGSGFRKEGLREFLERLEAGKHSVFSTHPPLKNRIERLKKLE
jgi:predicted Zn-dependent protease